MTDITSYRLHDYPQQATVPILAHLITVETSRLAAKALACLPSCDRCPYLLNPTQHGRMFHLLLLYSTDTRRFRLTCPTHIAVKLSG
jgi:hypothetical protein